MATIVLPASSEADSARKRLMAARVVLILGWIALAASLPMVIDYVPGGTVWSPVPLEPECTWAMIRWYVLSADLLRKILLAPFFIGLAAGALATILPFRILSHQLLWAFRISAVGVCEITGLGLLWVMVKHSDPNVPGGFGVGFLFFAVGGLLIGLAAWIRPIRARSGGKNGERNTARGTNPGSDTEGS